MNVESLQPNQVEMSPMQSYANEITEFLLNNKEKATDLSTIDILRYRTLELIYDHSTDEERYKHIPDSLLSNEETIDAICQFTQYLYQEKPEIPPNQDLEPIIKDSRKALTQYLFNDPSWIN